MNTHDEFKILISAYYDGEVSPAEKQQVETHLKECESCRKYLLQLEMLSSSLKKWSDETPSPDLEQNINRLSTKGEPMKPSTVRITQMAGSVLVVLFLAVMTLQTIARNNTQAKIKIIDSNRPRPAQIALSKDKLAQEKPTYSVKGSLKSATDDIGDQYAAGNTSVRVNNKVQSSVGAGALVMKDSASTVQYEPYYLNLGYKVTHEMQTAQIEGKTEYKELVRKRVTGGYQSSSYDDGRLGTNTPYPSEPYPNTAVLREETYGSKSYRPQIIDQRWPQPQPQSNAEEYDRIYENAFLESRENPLSTFSIDVDTASYSNVRRFLNQGQLPPPDAVRIEEMINYFTYDYPQPQGKDPFSITTEAAVCPWDPNHNLVMVGLQGKELDAKTLVPSNLVFLIDVSGSMDDPQKLPLLKSAFRIMVNQLKEQERIAIVAYAGNAGLVLESTPDYDKQRILEAINRLEAGGSTAGGEGIQLAYQVAKQNFISNGNNRVILATDGDFNVGVSSDSELVRLIEEKRNEGIFLSVLGFGTGNYKDSKMEKLADKGNGTYHYIDSLKEGEKVLVKELGSLLFTIAKDVKIQIEFNPNQVKTYRLIGYENRMMAKEDFNDDTKDAGELGAGHTVTALYEIVPANSREDVGTNVDPLRYQLPTVVKPSNDLMTVKLRYKEPKGFTSQLITKTVSESEIKQAYFYNRIPAVSENFRFASAVAEFGLLLRNSQYKGNASYDHVLEQANQARGNDVWGYRSEFIGLIERAKSLNPIAYPAYPVPYQE